MIELIECLNQMEMNTFIQIIDENRTYIVNEDLIIIHADEGDVVWTWRPAKEAYCHDEHQKVRQKVG